jgi:hypothetical protein
MTMPVDTPMSADAVKIGRRLMAYQEDFPFHCQPAIPPVNSSSLEDLCPE